MCSEFIFQQFGYQIGLKVDVVECGQGEGHVVKGGFSIHLFFFFEAEIEWKAKFLGADSKIYAMTQTGTKPL